MDKSLNGFRATLGIGWIALGAAGAAYARFRGVPGWVASAAVAAFLVEFGFYLVPAFPAVRELVAGRRLPAFLAAGAVLPYLACCCGAAAFHWAALARLAAVGLGLGLWYLALPRWVLTDVGFGTLVAWLLLGKFLAGIYPTPYPHVEIAILARLAVFQSAVLALMVARRAPETGYGFVPTGREWRIGALHFVCFAAVGLPLALGIHAVHFVKPAPLWVIAGTFLGFLWVVSLAEDFLFFGVLQPMLEQGTRNRQAGLLLASLLFGLSHLWFKGFPNWRWVLIAGMLGLFCGHARNQAGGIRAAVVTHALTVTAWRAFFA